MIYFSAICQVLAPFLEIINDFFVGNPCLKKIEFSLSQSLCGEEINSKLSFLSRTGFSLHHPLRGMCGYKVEDRNGGV